MSDNLEKVTVTIDPNAPPVRALHIVNGRVINAVLMPHGFQGDGQSYVVSEVGGPGDIYDAETGVFTTPEPPPPPVQEIISDRQFFQQLAIAGLVSESEALDAVKTGSLPSAFETFISSLPEGERFNARMLLSGAVEFRRSHPLTEAFAQMHGMTTEELDDLWRAAAAL
jgi:hypothetical protein